MQAGKVRYNKQPGGREHHTATSPFRSTDVARHFDSFPVSFTAREALSFYALYAHRTAASTLAASHPRRAKLRKQCDKKG